MKDVLNHYRTLVSEALERVYYDEIFEDRGLDLGRRLDCLAGRLARKIRPPRAAAPAPSLEGWEPLGWTTDEGVNFARFEGADMASHFAALNDHIAQMMGMRMPQRATGFRLDSKVEWREATPRNLASAADALSDLTDTFATDASPEPAKDATDD